MGDILFFISLVESTGLYQSVRLSLLRTPDWTGGLRQLQYSCTGEHYWTLPAEISRNKHIRDTTPPHTSPHIHTTPHHITLTAPQIKGQDYKDYKTYKTTTGLTNAFICRDIRHVF